MFRLLTSILLCCAFIAVSINGQSQRPKLYKDFDPATESDRFNNENKQGISYRLPNDTLPIRYDIALTTRVDENNFAFTGRVAIQLRALQSTNKITIHSKQLNIVTVELRSVSGFVVPIMAPVLDPVTEFLTIQTAIGMLALTQVYILEISYSGMLRTDDQGFYRSSYLNAQGETV
jgi:aminopeptidase N